MKLALIFLFLIPSAAQADELIHFEHEGRDRSYHMHTPLEKYLKKPVPLVIVLHGALDNAFGAEELTGFTEKSEEKKFIVVYPNGTHQDPGYTRELTWNGGNCCGYADVESVNDVGFIRELISRIQNKYPVDPKRIYVTGFSNGAILAYRLACEMPDVIAAAAPVSGAMSETCAPPEPVSILAFNGTADLKVLYEGGYSPVIYGSKYDTPVSYAKNFWKEKNVCTASDSEETGGVVRETFSSCKNGTEVGFYRVEGGGHEWPQDATRLIWDFFESHPKK